MPNRSLHLHTNEHEQFICRDVWKMRMKCILPGVCLCSMVTHVKENVQKFPCRFRERNKQTEMYSPLWIINVVNILNVVNENIYNELTKILSFLIASKCFI